MAIEIQSSVLDSIRNAYTKTHPTTQPSVASTSSSTPTADVHISPEAKAISDRRGQNSQWMLDKVDNDPKFAEQAAKSYSSYPDLQLVSLVHGEKVGSNRYKMTDAQNEYFQSGQHKADRDYFNSIASEALEQRRSIYSSMKSKGASGKDIFYAIMQYNETLPEKYKEMSGLEQISSATAMRTNR